MSKGEPIKLSTTFLVLFTQSFITTRSWLSWLLHGMGKVWQSKFEWEKPSIFGKCVLTPWASKNQKTYAILPCFHVFMFSSPFFLHVSSLRHLELVVSVFIPRFWLLASVSHGWEVVFVMLGIGLGFLTFLELLVHFPLTFLQFEVFLPWL